MSKNNFRLRPRHLARLDLYIQAKHLGISYAGHIMGYNDCMREGETEIFEKIRKGMLANDKSLTIEITDGLEDICELCPKKADPSCCDENAKLQDSAIADVYGAEIGRKYSLRELSELLSLFHAIASRRYGHK